MKFGFGAVASAILLATTMTMAVSAKRKLSVNDIQQRLQEGKFDMKRLMRNAIPYDQVLAEEGRNLEENANNNNGNNNNNNNGNNNGYNYNRQYNQYNQYAGQVYSNNNQGNNNNNNNNNQAADDDYAAMEITGDYRIQFNRCVSLRAQNYNLLLDNLVYYTQKGAINAIRNYVLFDICQVDNCYYEEDDTSNVYMVELSTFINAVVNIIPEEQEEYCRACEENEDYCRPEDDAVDDEDGDERRRWLENNNNGEVKMLDCDQCEAYNCYEDDENEDADDAAAAADDAVDDQYVEFDYQEIAEWVQEMSACKQVEGYWNGLNLFAGWTCNSDGSGIEIGVFLDAYCRIHHNTLSYANMLGNNYEESLLVQQSKDVIPQMFNKYINCADEEVQYVTPDDYYNGNYNNNNNNGDDGDDDDAVEEANEICRQLFEGGDGDNGGGSVPRLLSDCDGTAAYANYEVDDQFAEEDDDDDNANANANANNNNNQYVNNNGNAVYYYDDSWYQYDLSVYDLQDKQAICNVMANKFLSEEGVENVYDESSGGSLYDYDNGDKQSLWDNYNPVNAAKASNGISPAYVAVIVLSAVVLTALFMSFVAFRINKKKKQDDVVLGVDHNKSPLIIT